MCLLVPFEPFYRLKWKIAPPFHIRQLMESLPFRTPEAWKTVPLLGGAITHYFENIPGIPECGDWNVT